MSELARHVPSIAPFIALIPALIAGRLAKVRRRIVEQLKEARAFDAAHAIALDPPSRMESRALARLEQDGLVKRSGDRYYYDEIVAASRGGSSLGQWRLLLILLLVAIGLAVAIVLIRR